jgi:hypothetical protein
MSYTVKVCRLLLQFSIRPHPNRLRISVPQQQSNSFMLSSRMLFIALCCVDFNCGFPGFAEGMMVPLQSDLSLSVIL